MEDIMTNLFIRENPTDADRLDLAAMERCLGFKERRYIEELRILTRSTAVDCIIDDKFERIIYIIKPGDMGLAIGKGGDNIKKLARVLGKRIEMVEYDETREAFVVNMFKPAEIASVTFKEGTEPIEVMVSRHANFGLAIGKGGSTIEKARILSRRYYGRDISEIKTLEDGNSFETDFEDNEAII